MGVAGVRLAAAVSILADHKRKRVAWFMTPEEARDISALMLSAYPAPDLAAIDARLLFEAADEVEGIEP